MKMNYAQDNINGWLVPAFNLMGNDYKITKLWNEQTDCMFERAVLAIFIP